MNTSRKVFYCSQYIPPRDWLVYASLLWDKIWAGPSFPQNMFDTLDRLSAKSSDLSHREERLIENRSFYVDLATKTDIFDKNEAEVDESKLSADEKVIFESLQDGSVHRERARLGATTSELARIPSGSEAIAVYLSQVSPQKVPQVLRETDIFFPDIQLFRNSFSVPANSLVSAIEAIVPKKPETLTIPQIQDFREAYGTKRNEFRRHARLTIEDICQCSTEKEFHATLKKCEDIILRQLSELEGSYRDCKIDAFRRAMYISFAPPAFIQVLSSALDVGFYELPTAVAGGSFAVADVIQTLKKGRREISRSPWAYLMKLKDL